MMQGDGSQVKVALWARLEAKPGKEADVESFLLNGLSIVQDEPSTVTWYAVKLGPSTFGIFDTFLDESGPHLSWAVNIFFECAGAGWCDLRDTRLRI